MPLASILDLAATVTKSQMRIDEIRLGLRVRNLADQCVQEAQYFGLIGVESQSRNSDFEKCSQQSAASGHVNE